MNLPGALSRPTQKIEISEQKMCYTYPKSKIFQTKNLPHPFEKTDFLPEEKISYTCLKD